MKTKISPLSGILSPLRGERGYSKAFTLVELIVVITILAVLSAIGFVAFSGYLAGTRDTNRISQLKSIADGLELYGTKHDLPIPEDKVDIKVGTSPNEKTIAYQGYAGKNILETIEYSSEGVDPKDGTYFSYYLTKDKKYYQLMAFLEESDNLQNTKVAMIPHPQPFPQIREGSKFSPGYEGEMSEGQRGLLAGIINKTFALDYTARYPTVYGKKLGILTNTENTPVQEIEEIKTNGYLNISTATGTYIARFTDISKLTGTGLVLKNLEGAVKSGGIAGSCKILLDKKGSLKGKDGVYIIDPEGNNPFSVYCDMTTDGGGWTRTHLLKYNALVSSNTEEGYKGIFNKTTDYGENGYRTDISKFNYNEFAYLTDDLKNNVKYLKSGKIKTVGNKNEGFIKWIESYSKGVNGNRLLKWYYYTDINKKNKEQILIGNDPSGNSTGYRNMGGERLFSGNNGNSANTRSGTNFPFGKRGLSGNWCYGGKNECWTDSGEEWASLWLR